MDDLALAFEAALVGRACRVQRREADWAFELGGDVSLAVGCHWRLASTDGVAVTDEDDGHMFGLRKPVDTQARANARISGATVSRAAIDRLTGDLFLWFPNGLRLDILNNSLGYEGWQGGFSHEGKAVSIIAMGGGKLACV